MTTLATYKKRDGTNNRGKEFESLLGAYYAIKLTFSPEVIEFQASINNHFFGDFDDVILRVKYIDGAVKVFVFQLKHVEKAKTLQTAALAAKNGDFSLWKFFETYDKIAKLEKFYFIACTNRSANFKDDILLAKNSDVKLIAKRAKCVGNGIFDTNMGRNWPVYQFESDSNNFSDFLKTFYLYTNQQNDINLKETFSNLLKAKLQTDIFSLFFEYMRVWSTGTYVLTKLDVAMKLAELIFSPAIKTLSSDICNGKIKLIEEAVMLFDVTIIEDAGSNITKIWERVNSFADATRVSKACVKYGLTIKSVKRIQDLDNDKITRVLWFLGEVPLAVEIGLLKKDQIEVALDLLSNCMEKRKVILIGNFALYQSPNLFIFKNLSDISELDALRKKIVTHFTCSIQYKNPVTLEELGAFDSNITSTWKVGQLVQIATNNIFYIGEPPESLPSYIPRSFYKILLNFKAIDALNLSRIMLSGNGDLQTAKRHFHKRVIQITVHFDDSKHFIFATETEFTKKELDGQLSGILTTHHFRVVNNYYCLEWLNSNKHIEELEEFRQPNQNHVFVESEFENHYQKRIRVVVSHTGTGKTTLFKRIINQSSPDVWPIMVNLNDLDHSTYFKNEDKNNDIWKHLTHYTAKSKHYTDFELSLLVNFDKNKVIVLWDDFDKLHECCRHYFIKCVKKLHSWGATQWIAAKTTSQKYLENALDVFALSMVSFSKEQQTDYIKDRSKVTDAQTLEKFFTNLNIIDHNQYLGVPLHLYILTNNFNKNPDFLNSIFTLTDMCRVFIQDKYHHYLEQVDHRSIHSIKSLIESGKSYRLNEYKLAAMRTFMPGFSKDENSTDFVEDINTNGDFLGLIIKINEDGSVIFDTNFFGEYLCALWLTENRFLDLSKIIFEERLATIKFMFDLILAGKKPIFLAILYKQYDTIEHCEVETDAGGRNPLHVVCSYGNKHPLGHDADQVEVDSVDLRNAVAYLATKCEPLARDDLFRFTAFDYADQALCLGLIDILGTSNPILPNLTSYSNIANILYYALKFNYKNIIEAIINIPATEYQDDSDLLHIAVEFGHEDVLKWLFQEKIFFTCVNKPNTQKKVPMQIASSSGNLKILKYLKEKGATLPIRDPSVLSLAARRGCEDVVKFLLEHDCSPNEFYQEDCLSQSLYLAISHGYLEIVKLLVDYGVKFCHNEMGKGSKNALHLALEQKQFEIAQILIDRGMKLEDLDANAQNSYHHAAMNNHKSVVLFLMERNVNFNVLDRFGKSPLHYAAQYGCLEVVEILTAAGISLTQKDEYGFTPFHLAIQYGQMDIAKVLFGLGSQINTLNMHGRTPLHSAAACGIVDCCQWLLENGARAECMELLYGRRPLHFAAWNGYDDCVNLLIENDVEFDVSDKFGFTALHLAAETGSFESCQLLLKAGASITIENRNFTTPLGLARGSRNILLLMYEYTPRTSLEPHISQILSHLEDVNAVVDTNGSRPIHLAATNNNLEGVLYLLKKGVNFRVCDNLGYTPLHCAFKQFPSTPIIDLLLRLDTQKTLINARTNQGWTVLHMASQAGCFELFGQSDYHDESTKLISVLVQQGSEVNVVDYDGFTPFHYAAQSGALEILQELFDNGAQIDFASKRGRTALHMAATKGWVSVVQFLLDKKARVDIKDQDGDTPLDDAYKAEHPKIINLLASKTDRPLPVDRANHQKRTILHMIAKQNLLDLVKIFLEQEASVDFVDVKGNTPVDDAFFSRNFEIFEMLLSKSKTFDASKYNDYYKCYPLHVAATRNSRELIDLLLAKGAQIGVTDEDGNTPLHVALQCDHKDAIQGLLSESTVAEVNIQNKVGQTVLHLAKFRFDLVKRLIEKGSQIDLVDRDGNSPFSICFHEGYLIHQNISILKIKNWDWKTQSKTNGDTMLHMAMERQLEDLSIGLINNGVSINSVNFRGETPLHLAISSRKEAFVERILDKYQDCLDVNKQDLQGETLLHHVSKELPNLVKKLLDMGASPDITSKSGKTALDFTLSAGKLKIFCLLLRLRPETNLLTMVGDKCRTPLHFAVQEKNRWLVQHCLDKGLPISCVDEYRNTPLDDAVKAGNLEILKLLLNADKNCNTVNKSDSNGQTLLHLACKEGNFQLVKILVKNGALVGVYDGNGDTPSDLAKKNKHREVYDFLNNQREHSIFKPLGKLSFFNFFKKY